MTPEDIIFRLFATMLLIYDAFLIYQRIRDDLEEIRKSHKDKKGE